MIVTERIASNIQIALDTLRANKLRSALTILGVVIGVSTVMTMAAIVQGIQDQIVRTIEIAGPTTFYVVKVFSQTPVNPDRLPKWIRVRPDLVIDPRVEQIVLRALEKDPARRHQDSGFHYRNRSGRGRAECLGDGD